MSLLTLADPDAQTPARVGHKAASLAGLLAAGFPVPPGVIVPASVFAEALQPLWSTLAPLLGAVRPDDPATAASAATAVLEALRALRLPAALQEDLAAALPALARADAPLAVRSSAAAEDLPEASFAGLYDTILGPRSGAEVEEAILACWRSAFAAPALTERARHGWADAPPAMAVLLQPLLEAECAGVCLTVDPVAGRRDRLVISAAWGLGPGVVDGRVPNDTMWLRRDTLALERRRIATKDRRLRLGPGGLVAEPVPAALHSTPCLPAARRRRLAQFALALERHAGAPQDVEWAIADGRVWILQSRPLTALPPALAALPPFPVAWDDPADARRFWTLRRLPDRPGDLLRPLERDEVAARAGASADGHQFAGRDPMRAFRIVNERLYEGAVPNPLDPGDLRVRWRMLVDLNRRLEAEGRVNWDYWGPEIRGTIERLLAFDAAAATEAEVAEHLEDAFGAYRRLWMFHGPIFVHDDEPLREAVAAASGRAPEEVGGAIERLLQGEDTILTTIVDRLYVLARLARDTPGRPERLAMGGDASLAWLDALPEDAPFRAALAAFLADVGQRNGDGYGSEATLLTPTWRERPELVMAMIGAYLDPAMEPPATARARARQERDRRETDLLAGCADEAAADHLRRLLAVARRHRRIFEEHNHYIDQSALGCLRLAIMAAARRLVQRGELATPDDVFWLRRTEILAALRATEPASLADVVAMRRAEGERLAPLEPPACLGVPPAALPAPRPGSAEAETSAASDDAEGAAGVVGGWRGLGASPGRAEGRARVLAAGELLPALAPGDILVAVNAGPLWTPYFPLLAGIVLEEGSLGQHAAITAREYGVPAVVQLPDATHLIPDGARVAIDGEEGTVALRAP